MGCPYEVAPLRSGFLSTADDLLLVDLCFFYYNKGVDISAYFVCVFIYSGVFTSLIIKAMSFTCVSHSFVIGCCGVSVPVT